MFVRHAEVETTLGEVTIVAGDQQVTGLYFAEHRRRPAPRALATRVWAERDELLAEAAAQLTDYLAGRRREFDLPLAAAGDDFQHSVLKLVAEIPFGRTTTYGRIAEELGDKALAQRVGQAVGANPLCVFIPCHRVLGAGGSLTGYAGGLGRKRALLELEEPVPALAGRLF